MAADKLKSTLFLLSVLTLGCYYGRFVYMKNVLLFFQLIKDRNDRFCVLFWIFVMHFFVFSALTSFSLSVACGLEHVLFMYIDGLECVWL